MKRSDLPEELQNAIYNYCIKSYSTFRPEFRKALESLMPEWVPGTARSSGARSKHSKSSNMVALIQLAKAHRGRPRSKSGSRDERRLGVALNNYTQKSSSGYNPEFYATISQLRPDWFGKKDSTVRAAAVETVLQTTRKQPPSTTPEGRFWRHSLYRAKWGPWRNTMIDKYNLDATRWEPKQ